MGKKLYVGNLPFDTTSEDLQALFGKIGPCDSASVITDRATGRVGCPRRLGRRGR